MEGLFRLSGATQVINQLKEKIDTNREVKFTPDMDPHVISGLIKLYLREMPEPLLTFQLFEVFRSVCCK